MGPGFGQGQSRTMDGQKHGLAGHDPITHFSCPRLPRRLCVCHPKRPTFSLTCILGAANQDASGAHPPRFPAAPSRHLNKSRVCIPSHVQDSKDRQREKIGCRAASWQRGLWITAALPSQVRPDGRASCAGLSTLQRPVQKVSRRFRFRPQQGTRCRSSCLTPGHLVTNMSSLCVTARAYKIRWTISSVHDRGLGHLAPLSVLAC